MKKVLYFLLILCLVIFFRQEIFNTLFSYEIVKERNVFNFNNENFNVKNDKIFNENINEIINDELDKTSKTLNFTFEKCNNDPNKLINSKKANCIGYSAFLSSSIQKELEKNHLEKDWKVEHKVAKIYFLNFNINEYFKSSFFKDHDFVIVENLKTKEQITIDPSLFDYFKIDRIVLKKK